MWTALTEGELSKKYFFGRRVESDWKVGPAFQMWQPNSTLNINGKVIESDRPKKLSVTWRVEWIEELRHLPEAIVTYQLDALGKVVRLTMTESHPKPVDEKLFEGGRRGGPIILSGLKTFLETGKTLPELDFTK